MRVWLLFLGAMATVGFAAILLVGVPNMMLQRVPVPKELRPYSETEARGRAVYVANGCIYCHSQQVRDPTFTTDVLRGWGSRASVPSDYLYDRPHLVGTMRTGPDLMNVGDRLPDRNWHLLHLYQPRALVPWSIMPSFPYLFEQKDSAQLRAGDQVVPLKGSRVVVARPDAIALVDYLLSLRRDYPVPRIESPHARSRTQLERTP